MANDEPNLFQSVTKLLERSTAQASRMVERTSRTWENMNSVPRFEAKRAMAFVREAPAQYLAAMAQTWVDTAHHVLDLNEHYAHRFLRDVLGTSERDAHVVQTLEVTKGETIERTVTLDGDFAETETLSVSCTRFVDEGSGREAVAPEVVPERLLLHPGGTGEVRVKVRTSAPEFEAGHTYTALVHVAGRTTKTLCLQLKVLARGQ